jgi:hypothetical protein
MTDDDRTGLVFRARTPGDEPATKTDMVLIDAAIRDFKHDMTVRMIIIAAIAVLFTGAVRIFVG